MNLHTRLQALEGMAVGKRGHLIFFCSDGQYWQSVQSDYRDVIHGKDGGAPEGAKIYTRAEVDKAGEVANVVIVTYVQYDSAQRADAPNIADWP